MADDEESLQAPTPGAQPHSLLERWLEEVLFASRWLLAPFYLGLSASLLLLLAKFAQKAVALVPKVTVGDSNDMIVGVLSLIDLSLMANLVIMVIFAGYENFVSRFDLDSHRDKPDWMGHVGFGGLKIKLMTSIIAISAIQLLEAFMNIDHESDRQLYWLVGIHLTFVVSTIVLALAERFGPQTHPSDVDTEDA